MNLLNSLRTLGKYLLKENIYDEPKILQSLNKTLIQLRIVKSRYLKKKLSGAENIINLLQESLGLYIEGIEDIISFLKDKDRDLLSIGLFKVEEADDILVNLEEILLQNREFFESLRVS